MEQGSRGTVFQRVRNKNNLEEMQLRRRIDELKQRLSFEMYRIEMERLDWKMFLKEVRNCESDDLSEFAPLFEEFLANGNKNRRTRFRDLFKPEDIGVDERNPLKLDYKSIKAATDKIRFDLADVAKSRNESSRSRRSSRLAAYLESEMSFETYTPVPKATLTLPKTPKTPADKGAIITLPEKVECKEEPVGFSAPPMSKRNETMLEPIPGSPAPEVAVPVLEKIKAIAQPKQESPMKSRLLKSRENGLSTSLPNLSRQHPGAAGVYTDSSKGHTRSYTDGKEKKKLKRKPLRDRIKDFYDDIQPLYSPKEDNLYLPPILTT